MRERPRVRCRCGGRPITLRKQRKYRDNSPDNTPQNQPAATRIVAGQTSAPKRPLGLKIGFVAGILALVGGGIAVALAVSGNNAATSAAASSPQPS